MWSFSLGATNSVTEGYNKGATSHIIILHFADVSYIDVNAYDLIAQSELDLSDYASLSSFSWSWSGLGVS